MRGGRRVLACVRERRSEPSLTSRSARRRCFDPNRVAIGPRGYFLRGQQAASAFR